MFAVQADGSEVTTVEGIASPEGELSPVQSPLRECHRLQCGFCTPGFVMTITAMLRVNPHPTDDAIRQGMSGTVCRFPGSPGIIRTAPLDPQIGRPSSRDRGVPHVYSSAVA